MAEYVVTYRAYNEIEDQVEKATLEEAVKVAADWASETAEGLREDAGDYIGEVTISITKTEEIASFII